MLQLNIQYDLKEPQPNSNKGGLDEDSKGQKDRINDNSMNDMENGENKSKRQNTPIDQILEEELLEREKRGKEDDSEFKGCWDTLTGCISSIWLIFFNLLH